jgi:uncharacterized protein (TIRG00374 family)
MQDRIDGDAVEDVVVLTGRPATRKLSLRTVALYAVALVFLAVVVWRSRIWDSGEALGDVSWPVLVAVPAITLLLAVPLAWRQQAILSSLGYRISALPLAPVAFYGNTVSFMTPALSGELLRPALMDRAFSVPLHRGVSVVLFERLYSMGLFCVSGLLALSFTGLLPDWLVAPVAILLVVAMFGPLILVRLFNIPVGRITGVLPGFVQRRLIGLDEAGDTFEQLWRSPRVAAWFVPLSLVTFGILLAQFWIIASATGTGVSPHEAWVVLVVAALAGMASGLPFGLGAGDAVMVSLLTAYGADVTEAGAAVILTRILINLPSGLLGMAAYLIALRQGSSSATGAVERQPLATALATERNPHVQG